MSNRLLSEARSVLRLIADKRLTPSHRLVLTLMADNYNEAQGKAWPGHGTLAMEAGVGGRRVRKLVDDLERWGALAKLGGGHRGRRAEYRVIPEALLTAGLAVAEDRLSHREGGPAESERRSCGAEKEVLQNRPSPRTPEIPTTTGAEAIAPVLNVLEGGGGAFQDHCGALNEVLSQLTDAGCAVGPRAAEDLRAALAPYLAAGWAPAALAQELTKGELPKPLLSMAKLLLHRLGEIPVTPPAARVTPTGAKPWCGRCDADTYRFVKGVDGAPTNEKCTCHPGFRGDVAVRNLKEIAS